jgi:hypothetical protein
MSPDLERRLREAGAALAGPDAPATKRARETALGAVASAGRPGGRRALAIGGTALAAAVAIGVAIGSFAFAGQGTAGEPRGLGFLPAEGWMVLQSGTPATPDRPGVALAANVPLRPSDAADGFPYSTLRSLPAHGVVLVASFMRLRDQRESTPLPLSLGEAVPYIRYGGQVRPDRPLGQYELRAFVEGYAVEVQAYFGTREPSEAQFAEAQRQLDRLVISPEGEIPAGEAPRAPARGEAVSIAFQRYYDAACRCYKLRFFGQVSSGAENEYVSVMYKPCRGSFSTAITGAQTTAGGGWEVVPDYPPGAGEFRARWNDELSEPVTYRPPLVPNVVKRPKGAYRVEVYSFVPPGGKPVILTGRSIELQRLKAAGEWSRIRRGKLIGFGSNLYNRTYFANFTVPRGLTLRAFVPAKTALPCWSAAVSKTFKS